MSSRQDTFSNSSPDSPSPAALSSIRKLYRAATQALDRHIRRIVEIYEQANVWDDTLLILASDHGQSFNGDGALHHGVSLSESTIRVPLLIRPPGGEGQPRVNQWVSTKDIFTIVLNSSNEANGRASYKALIPGDASPPIYSFDDSVNPGWRHGSDAQRMRAGSFVLAAYGGNLKALIGVDPSNVCVFDITEDPGEAINIWDPTNSEQADLVRNAKRQAAEIVAHIRLLNHGDASDRLASWGYT